VSAESPREQHTQRRNAFAAQAEALDQVALRISVARLALFFIAGTLVGVGMSTRDLATFLSGLGAGALFFVAVGWHARVYARRERALVRKEVHDRNLRRLDGQTKGLPDGEGLVAAEHPYGSDLDLVGVGSVFERFAVVHTHAGSETFARWLAAPADEKTIRLRQAAVEELSKKIETRQDLEASVLDSGSESIDARPFVEFCEGPKALLGRPLFRWLGMLLPPVTVTLFALSGSALPSGTWAPLLILQAIIARHLEPDVAKAYAKIVSKRRFVESYRAVLKVAEDMPLTSPLVVELKRRLEASGAKPSVELGRLELWASLFEVRAQGLVHVVLNLFLLWDLNVLLQLERWAERAGTRTRGWLEVLGEIEALASLATIRALDPTTTFPEIVDGKEALVATGLAHPLIAEDKRVRNDVTLAGPGTSLVITGSNMAGKSTLLRAIGVNVALALAGGPVCAESMRVPIVRMRASMRIADSLQHGASYFQAELSRLRTVIAEAEASPPILFLLDELLRGTNARARHRGARAVVLHLLARHATGLVATHDIALSELEEELDGRVKNFHFTDVLAPDGEMIFDYRLREGVVKTSNALRLLAMAGVEVEADDKVRD
jgi:hypothetical protein